MQQIPTLVSYLVLLSFSSPAIAGAEPISATFFPPDTVLCPGNTVQLFASGGDSYQWQPAAGLSCTDCANPVASPTVSTTYTVDITRQGLTERQTFYVGVYGLDLGADITVCNNALITLNPGGESYPDATYAWQGFPPDLSCTDCPSPTLTGLTTGIYFYFAELTAPGCSFNDTLRITVVNGQQPEYVIAGDTTICLGAAVALGGAPVSGTFYTWTSDPPGFTSNLPNPVATPTVSTTYFLATANSVCPISSFDSLRVTVLPAIELNLAADTLVCQGQPVLLNTAPPQAGVNYTWSPDDGSLSDRTAANPIARPETPTVYVVTADNGACLVTDTVVVDIAPIDIRLSADTVSICLGGFAEVTVLQVTPSGSAVLWSPLLDLAVTPDGLQATATPDESRLYTATVTAPGCSRSASVWVQVDSLPANLAIMPDDTTVCQGSLVLLTSTPYDPAAFANIEFRWEPATGQQTPDSLYNMVIQADTTLLYQRINTSGACVDTSVAKINVIPTAVMTITPQDTIVCPGQTVQLNLTYTPGVTNIMWTPPSGLSCTDCDNPLATIIRTSSYAVSGEFMGCPVSSGVVVQAYPEPGYLFPADTKLCEGDTLFLNTINDPATNYTWTSTAPGFGTQTTATPIWVPDQPSASFFLDAVTLDGCRVFDTLNVTFNTATLDVQGDTTICKGRSTILRAITNVPGTFQWNTGQTTPTISVAPQQSRSYTVTFTYAGDCQLSGIATVEVEPGPEVLFPPLNQRQLCLGDSSTLNLNPKPGAVYQWSSNPPGFSSNTAAPVVTPQVPTTYTVTATLGVCQEILSVTLTPLVATVEAGPDTAICAGEPVQLTAVSTGAQGGSFLWTPPGNTGADILVQPDTTTTYFVQYTLAAPACTATDSVTVFVSNNFNLSIGSVPDTNRVSLGQPITLSAVVEPTQNLSGFAFTWTEVRPNMEILGTGESIEYVPSLNQDTVVRITLSAISPDGCEKLAFIELIIVQPVVKFPNAFTPGNGDNLGINDVFKPVTQVGIIFIDQFDIYNRWGQKIYTSNDPQASWDGTVDGQPAPTDVYVYYIQYRRGDGSLIVTHGEVTLLR